ncbi:MAG: histidine--tRNA ligase [Desulfovibrionaceae bacterium]
MVQKIKGFADLLEKETALFTILEEKARDIFSLYNYKEIRTPLVEFTELFSRSIGASTDIIQKEMYTFMDKKNRGITLRPEATAGSIRAYIDSGRQGPSKFFTFGPMFRYERPQKGRMRQFHQINVECIGYEESYIDAEMISMLLHFLNALAIKDTTLLLNSLGCSCCRPEYKRVLISYLKKEEKQLCTTCQERMEINPLRTLDCKIEECIERTKDTPIMLDYLCAPCLEHFLSVKSFLDLFQLSYTIEPRLVRGLDYYIRTTFEVVSNNIGSQSSIAGGGRYDGLIKQLGGKDLSGIGFALGMERLALLLHSPSQALNNYYIAVLCESALEKASILANTLRKHNYSVFFEHTVKNMKKHLKQALSHAESCIFMGEHEIENTIYTVKNFQKEEQKEYTLGDILEQKHL